MSNTRLISATPSADEVALDGQIRPRRLADYVGQPVVREQMEIFIGAARKRAEALDHVLIFGPPGLGKISTRWAFTSTRPSSNTAKRPTGPAPIMIASVV